jgi:cell division septum initiation protein DivIVA
VNENLRRALAALERAASELRDTSSHSSADIRARLRQAAEEILDRLDEDPEEEPEDLFSSLDRQSKSIAEDLRRADRLMRERTEGR